MLLDRTTSLSVDRKLKSNVTYQSFISFWTKPLYRYSQHLKWSKLHHLAEEKDVVSFQKEQSSDEDADVGTDGDNKEDDGGLEMDNDDDDVRIDDVLQELVNKQASESKVAEENLVVKVFSICFNGC